MFTQAPTRTVNSCLERGLPFWIVFAFGLLGAGCLHLAYAFPRLTFLLFGSFASFVVLSLARSRRLALYPALLIGLVVYAPPLQFFWTIFGPAAVLLWLVLAFWLALFAVIAWRIRKRWGVRPWLIALPILWTGIEYFRSELYYLKFSWVNAGYALAPLAALDKLIWPGMYGTSFVVMGLVSICLALKGWRRFVAATAFAGCLALLTNSGDQSPKQTRGDGQVLRVAGIQAEFPPEEYVPHLLDKALTNNPNADLLVLSEYTFEGAVPACVRDWCKRNARYLIAGGKDFAGNDYYNTAFVVSPAGEIVFKQAKSVPIQFFRDGMPAKEQNVWNSPWGKVGICICYDLSYTRVTDELIRQGAQVIVNPTMDVIDWGESQHQLHSRVPPVRAAEYGVPIVRVASSGISQLVDRHGRVLESAPFGAEEAVIGGELQLPSAGRVPVDRWLAPLCVGLTGVLLILCFVPKRRSAHSISNELSQP